MKADSTPGISPHARILTASSCILIAFAWGCRSPHDMEAASLDTGDSSAAAAQPADAVASPPAADQAPAGQSVAPGTTPPASLPEGLIVEDLIVGDGPVVGQTDTVEADFVARFAGGAVYDSSEARRRTLSFPLGRKGLIEGLRSGIPGMRVGGTRRITIPWRLAYGAEGRDPVPPRTDLVFEITARRIQPAH